MERFKSRFDVQLLLEVLQVGCQLSGVLISSPTFLPQRFADDVLKLIGHTFYILTEQRRLLLEDRHDDVTWCLTLKGVLTCLHLVKNDGETLVVAFGISF